jgi:hypothetical protein
MAGMVTNLRIRILNPNIRIGLTRLLFVFLALICLSSIGWDKDLNRDMASELLKIQLEKEPFSMAYTLGTMEEGKYLKRQIPVFPNQCDIKQMKAFASNGFIAINLEKTLPARGYGPEEYYSIEVTPKGQQYQVGEIKISYGEKIVTFKLLTLEKITVTGITTDGSDTSAKVVEFTGIFKSTPIADFFNAKNAGITEKQLKAKFKEYDDGWRFVGWLDY